jgi:hypothetical protein
MAIFSKVVGAFVIGLGLISAATIFFTADAFAAHGHRLIDLQSQAGGTMAEVFYQRMGGYGVAFAALVRGLAAGVATIAIGLGALLITRK